MLRLMSYLRLAAAHRRILAFGFALTLFSSFGQTFFIALFGAEIRGEFGLTHGSFGALYALATLGSGFILIWLGGAIDRVSLRVYVRVVVAGLVTAAVLFGSARGLLWLGIAVFTLRLFGQGLMSHTAMTTMSRFFSTSRGKAMSIAALGFPIGEAVLPRLFVAVKEAVGWRISWAIVALGLAAILVPFVEWLLRKAVRGELGETDASAVRETKAGAPEPPGSPRQWSRREVARDPRFHLVLPAVLAPPFIATGVFFHQVALVEAKGWTVEWFAVSFAAFAASQVAASLSVGPLVDRWGASRLLRTYLLPLAAGLLLLAVSRAPVVAMLFMLAAGVTGGVQSTVAGAYWAEVYGVRHLGAIRSLVMALMVFSTAAAPVLSGWMIDTGRSMEFLAALCLGGALAATGLAAWGGRLSSPGGVNASGTCGSSP